MGGIVGISQDHESCEQWAPKKHLKSFLSTSFKEMTGVSENTEHRKDLKPERRKKDEEDVLSLITTNTEEIVNSWEFDPENTEKDSQLNIARGPVPPLDVLLNHCYQQKTKVKKYQMNFRINILHPGMKASGLHFQR